MPSDSYVGKLLTRKEAAEALGISTDTLDAERKNGRLTFIQRKPNGKVWVSEEAIREYLGKGVHRAIPEKEVTETYRKRRV